MRKPLPTPRSPLLARAGLALGATFIIGCDDDDKPGADASADVSGDTADVATATDTEGDGTTPPDVIPPQPPPFDVETGEDAVPPQQEPSDAEPADSAPDDVLPPPSDTLDDTGPTDVIDQKDLGDPFDGVIPPQPPPRDAFFEPEPEES